MDGRQIESLNRATNRFATDVREDELAAKRLDIGVVSFGGEVQSTHTYQSAQHFIPDKLVADGETPMGQALYEAIAMTETRIKQLKEFGIPHYRPWIILMTDGEPTDADTEAWEAAKKLINFGVRNNKFTFFPLVTESGNKEMIGQLCSSAQIFGLDSHKFSEFFVWLSRSLQQVAKSQIGEKVNLPDPRNWTIDV